MFASKEELFRSAVSRALEHDLAEAAASLRDTDLPLAARLLEAFDHWAERYVGPLVRDIAGVVEDNPDLLGSLATTAVAAAVPQPRTTADQLVQTLISTSIGIKQQVNTREEYLARMTVAIGLSLR
ncbi:hypothetical protein [Amycolatopsis sp. H20-H5]|uniref:hypothetical protein n=1 Tax=Amycolatopsis sp. H20-H5 TaxID=3046309 RepID=UPI002DBE564A|nr:hypothetical protein [Amycolatopsis sp. H20-H5]MEC3978002.1 hypothetical protein [Amycolatopsis sp. H20-H5]